MTWLKERHHLADLLQAFYKWTIMGALMGAIGGVLGALFSHLLHFVTALRGEYPWLIFLLPLGGIATVALYRVLRLYRNRGTNEIIEATLDGSHVSPLVAPAIVTATAMTHLFGGSAGREGAALQLGGAVASGMARCFHLQEENRKILVMAGMSAVFAGLFGTPLTAALFCMEFGSVGTIYSPAVLPCYLAAYISSRISRKLGVYPEVYILDRFFGLSLWNGWRYLMLAAMISLLGIFMCAALHKAEHLAARYLPNPFLRVAVGGLLILGMTLAVGDQRYNGAGMDLAIQAVVGKADWYAFLLKLLFTSVTLAAGFKGGEIVPTFCIGACFGCVVGRLLGLDPGFAAALGLVGLFCCATNSPIASILLSMEMFGSANLHLFALICVVCFTLSGDSGLYASQVIQFGKATMLGANGEQRETQ